MECYSTIKRNEILTNTIWMKLGYIMLSERRPKKSHIRWFLLNEISEEANQKTQYVGGYQELEGGRNRT